MDGAITILPPHLSKGETLLGANLGTFWSFSLERKITPAKKLISFLIKAKHTSGRNSDHTLMIGASVLHSAGMKIP